MDGYHYYRKDLDKMPDPKEAHDRRGAEFTFDSVRFVRDMIQAKINKEAKFPSFDHALKDPVEEDIGYNSNAHDLLIVEGLYVLLDKDPWAILQKDGIF
jgi:pantothenate kinase